MKKTILLFILALVLLVGCGKSNNNGSEGLSYLQNSRKAAFVDTVVSYMNSTMREVNSAKDYKFYSVDTLYLIPVGNDKSHSCILPESGGASPFSDEWNFAYVGLTYDGMGYEYYYLGEDKEGNGLKFLNRKTIVDNGTNEIYNGSLEKSSGYDILKKVYNGKNNNIVYEQNTSDFTKLSNILNVSKNYNTIIVIGSQNCSYK